MDLKNLFKNVLNKKKSFKKNSFTVNPDVYWKSILVLSLCMIIGFFAFGFFLLMNVNNESSIQEGANAIKLKTVNKERLDQVIEYFSKREKASLNIINLPSSVIDPSS